MALNAKKSLISIEFDFECDIRQFLKQLKRICTENVDIAGSGVDRTFNSSMWPDKF